MVGGCHGRRGDGQPREKWGRVAAKRGGGGGKRGGPLGFCGRKEPTPQMTSALHPTAHNPFSHPRTEDQLLVNIFFGILQFLYACLLNHYLDRFILNEVNA
jgi:hypothetical protein